MLTINVRETREKLSHLLDVVEAGEEIVILRRGKPAARLTGVASDSVQFPDRKGLREALPPAGESAAKTIRTLRDEERY